MKNSMGAAATISRLPVKAGSHQGYDKTAGHHKNCTCRPCRKKREQDVPE